jgi:outer membrane usher protein
MLRLAMAAVFAMSSEGVAGQPDTLGSIGLYQEGAHSFVFIATQEPVTYSLTPDSDAGQYVLSLQGKGISELMRRALRRPDLLTTGIVESFAMIDADHVDVLLRSPPEGLELKDVSGTRGMDHCVLVGVAHSAFPTACPAGRPQPQPASKLSQGIYEIFVNGEDEGAAIVLSNGDGEFLFDADDLKSWRINPAFADSLDHVIYEDKKYVSVSHAQGVTVVEDAKASAIRITFNPSDFQATVLRVNRAVAGDPTRSSYGAFLNYNFSAQSTQGHTTGGALLDANAFGPAGTASSDFLIRTDTTGPTTVRLDSYFEADNPTAVSTFRVGDSLTGASDWALPERFAGVQWATDFSTRPDLVTFPLQSLAGTASVPSTVELFLNQSLLLRQEVPEGPFAIQQFPVITGDGQLRMVVLNALGEQQTIDQPFYADASLLQPGMQSYSYEAGFERLNYGLLSNDYGGLLASGTDRLGITDNFTGAIHGEWRPGIQTLGVSAAMLVSTWGVLSSSLAGSHDLDGNGALFGLGFDHHDALFDFGFRAQVTSRDFNQLGLAPGMLSPSSMLSAYAALEVAKGGSLAFNVTQQNQRNQPSLGVEGMSYSQSLGAYGYVQLSVMHTRGEDGGMLVGMNYTCPFGSRSSAALDVQRQGGTTQETVQFQQNAPYGNGLGYRLLAGLGPDSHGEADVTENTDTTSYYLALANTDGNNAYQANATGSVALLDGEVHFTRQIPDSFGVVRVPGYSGVRVYEDNQLVGTTDASGDAFVPNLRSYQANGIQIEQADLPLDVDVSSTSMTAVPYLHSGLILTFPVKQIDNTSYVLVRPNGAFVPAGSQAVYEGQTYPVGFNGLVYVPTLAPSQTLMVSWPTGHCVTDLSKERRGKTDAMPRLECQ